MVNNLAIGTTLAVAVALFFQYSSKDSLSATYTASRARWHENMVEDVDTSSFYKTPSNFSAETSKPGDLLRFELVSGTELDKAYSYPPGLTLYRILYVSEDVDRIRVPASAFVLIPYNPAHYGRAGKPFRTTVWTHGTSGITRHCAPSLQTTLYYEFTGLFNLALSGYAVIAPDYAGQGSDTQFHYCAAASHAYDVSNALRASRSVFPTGLMTYEWAVIGHSEGGLTAWHVNEHEAEEPTGGFVGTVSLAPAMNPQAINQRALAMPELKEKMRMYGTSFYPATFLESIRRLNASEVDISKYLTDAALKRLELVQQGGCYKSGLALFGGLEVDEVFKDVTWVNQSFADAWTTRARADGLSPLAAPMLVVEGAADEAVDPAVNQKAYLGNCAANPSSRIRHSIYPGMDHMSVVFAGQGEWIQFLEALFAKDDSILPKGCEEITQAPVTGAAGVNIFFGVSHVTY